MKNVFLFLTILFLSLFCICEQKELNKCQSLKMLVLRPIHFEEFQENLSFDLRLIEDFLEEKIQDDLEAH